MPTFGRAEPRFPVGLDELLLEEDLAHATVAGRAAITATIEQIKDTGIPKSWCKRCQPEGNDGTRLAGCVKLYIPQPAGPWGAVFTGDRRAGIPTLVLLAVGQRHPKRPWTPSVYDIAYRRLKG